MCHDMKTTDRPPRRYHSPLRSRQTEQTRETILAALVDQLGQSRPGEYSLSEVAARAGVSVRTLYRHFGGREALLAALDGEVARRALPPIPDSVEGLCDYPVALFSLFDAHAPWVEAMLKVGEAEDFRVAGKPRRVAAVRQGLAAVTVGLPPERAAEVEAVFKHLMSVEAWKSMRDDFGMDGAASGRAVAWALRALVADLRRSKESS